MKKNLISKIKEIYILLKNRYKAKSPAFFIKLKKTAISIGASAVAAVTINTSMSLGLDLTWLNYVIVAMAAIAATSQFTKE